MFRKVGELDFVAMHRELLDFWEAQQVFPKLVEANRGGPRFSFIDGPITANNPMGVHHARGRTYKDVVQRYKAMCGFDQRFQNGFDCQGLWVEVEVEKALGGNSKRDIETMGLETFARACRERVLRFARLQTEQSRKLGQWMDWPRSYYTMSDRNIEYIWHFLGECERRGWLYLGHRVMPWCVRCGTSISQHEMLESYVDLTHQAVVVALPVTGRDRTYLLTWTTTPWTLPANVALAVHPDLEYEGVAVDGRLYYLARAARARFRDLGEPHDRVPGSRLVGLRYLGPFDELPAQRDVGHRVVAWTEVSPEEGTGIVHIAPGCGQQDFELGRLHGLPVIAPADEEGRYLPGFGPLEGHSVFEAGRDVVAALRAKGLLHHQAPYRHRYPTCWRCGQELIFRLVDEWFIRADELRPRVLAANVGVRWHPEHMQLRMNDWLANMGDWCISRKRYWGLPLPFYPCPQCRRVTVVASRRELRVLAADPARVDALAELHRPWIDRIGIRCPGCGLEVPRIAEVGDCWLDGGIVPFSTLGYLEDRDYWSRWFPADVVVEGAAQLRGWFYALLFMSVTLEDRAPYRTVVAHDRVLAEDGREMHKSWGNAVWFDEAVERMGPDVLRYLFSVHPITDPIRFGWDAGREVKRRFLTLWNVYRLFVTYARLDHPPLVADAAPPAAATGLEAWLLARLQSVIREVRAALDAYQLRRALLTVEGFIQEDLSNWYVRRRRRQFWKGEMTEQKARSYQTLYHVLVRVSQLLAPFTPFLAEEMYRNLVAEGFTDAPISVHLTRFPAPLAALEAPGLVGGVSFVRRALTVGLAARQSAGLKVRQPLARAVVVAPASACPWLREFEADLLEELNVEGLVAVPSPEGGGGQAPGGASDAVVLPGGERIVIARGEPGTAADREVAVVLDIRLTPALTRKGLARQLVHQVQLLRKKAGLSVEDRIHLSVAAGADVRAVIEEHRDHICAETLATGLTFDEALSGLVVEEASVAGTRVRLALRPLP